MGPHRTKALIALFCLGCGPALAQEPGWHYSPLPGEGDRASMGCAEGSSAGAYTCLSVRCEDDFSTGVHIHSSRPAGVTGLWEVTLDREARMLRVDAAPPYGGRIVDADGWLLDGLRHGTFVYLRHDSETDDGFALIGLSGSFNAIAEALLWCAPRVPDAEQNGGQGVDTNNEEGESE